MPAAGLVHRGLSRPLSCCSQSAAQQLRTNLDKSAGAEPAEACLWPQAQLCWPVIITVTGWVC